MKTSILLNNSPYFATWKTISISTVEKWNFFFIPSSEKHFSPLWALGTIGCETFIILSWMVMGTRISKKVVSQIQGTFRVCYSGPMDHDCLLGVVRWSVGSMGHDCLLGMVQMNTKTFISFWQIPVICNVYQLNTSVGCFVSGGNVCSVWHFFEALQFTYSIRCTIILISSANMNSM